MNKKLRVYIQYFFFIALAALFVWLSLRHIDAEKWRLLKSAIARARLWIFFPVMLLLLVSHWLRAIRWKMLIVPLGFAPRLHNSFFAVMIGYLVNLGAPRLGEIIKCTVLARYEKIPADKLIGTIVAERAFDLLSLILVFILAVLMEFETIGAFAMNSIRPLYTTSAGQFSYLRLFIIVSIVLLLLFLVRVLLTRFLHVQFVQKLKVVLQGIWHGLTSIRYVQHKFRFMLVSLGIWALYLLSTWLSFQVLTETSALGIGTALAVLAMGSIGMILAPGGIGAYPLLIQQTLLLYGIAEIPFGQAIGWLSWIAQFVIFIIFGALSFVLLPLFNKKNYATS